MLTNLPLSKAIQQNQPNTNEWQLHLCTNNHITGTKISEASPGCTASCDDDDVIHFRSLTEHCPYYTDKRNLCMQNKPCSHYCYYYFARDPYGDYTHSCNTTELLLLCKCVSVGKSHFNFAYTVQMNSHATTKTNCIAVYKFSCSSMSSCLVFIRAVIMS